MKKRKRRNKSADVLVRGLRRSGRSREGDERIAEGSRRLWNGKKSGRKRLGERLIEEIVSGETLKAEKLREQRRGLLSARKQRGGQQREKRLRRRLLSERRSRGRLPSEEKALEAVRLLDEEEELRSRSVSPLIPRDPTLTG